MNGIKPAPAQFVGIWEREMGVRTEGGTWTLVRVDRESLDLETFGARVLNDLRNENGHPGFARDAIVQRWVLAHGVTEYIHGLYLALNARMKKGARA